MTELGRGLITMTNLPGSREGWTCPKCGRVYSPTWFECQACNSKVGNSPRIVPTNLSPELFLKMFQRRRRDVGA